MTRHFSRFKIAAAATSICLLLGAADVSASSIILREKVAPAIVSADRPDLAFPRSVDFPLPAQIIPNVEFWKRVYSQYGRNIALIHDDADLSRIYEKIDFDRENFKGSYRQKRKYVLKRLRQIKSDLQSLYKNHGQPRNDRQRRLKERFFGETVDRREYRAAAGRLRAQQGLADGFRISLERSGKYLGAMRAIFREEGLPEELCALPHVESAFNYRAYSSAGAAGIWQFTRHTGRLFMRINRVTDERRDPFVATRAAAKFLKNSYERLGSWPLAVTSYNHGLQGMEQAKKHHGDDFGEIVMEFKGRYFGFASRNFYAEFLAALHVARSWRAYFGEIEIERPMSYALFETDSRLPLKKFAKALDVPIEVLRQYNPGYRRSVWQGYRNVPKGYQIRAPFEKADRIGAVLAALSKTDRSGAISRANGTWHEVARGETISEIADMYNAPLGALVDINDLDWERHGRVTIYPGQKLRIPSRASERANSGSRLSSLSKTSKRATTPDSAGSSETGRYRIKRGDTLYEIARATNTTVAELARLNGISPRAKIYPGGFLRLKGSAPYPTVASGAAQDNQIEIEEEAPESDSTELELVLAGETDAPAPKIERAPKGSEPIEIPASARQARAARPGGSIEPLRDDYDFKDRRGTVGVIRIEPGETLGHYAEWLNTTPSEIQRLNRRVNLRRAMKVGSEARIPLDHIANHDVFVERRMAHHKEVFESFFRSHAIDGTKSVRLKSGQSTWELLVKENQTPLWLAFMYNRDIDLSYLKPGDEITIPLVRKL